MKGDERARVERTQNKQYDRMEDGCEEATIFVTTANKGPGMHSAAYGWN
jgi:hypothetical protein